MADLLHTLMNAGLDPLDAQQIVNAARANVGLPSKPDAVLQDARRAWWSSPYIPADLKRILDASTVAEPATIPPSLDVLKADLESQLDRFAKADLLTSPLVRIATRMHMEEAARLLDPLSAQIPDLTDFKATIKTYSVLRDEDKGEDYPIAEMLGVYIKRLMDDAFIKGGEGSGNFRHHGRPGEQGGSQAQNGDGYPSAKTEVTFQGDVASLSKAGVTEDDLRSLYDLGIPGSHITVEVGRYDGGINMGGVWRTADNGFIGQAYRTFYPETNKVGLDMLSLSSRYGNQGMGKRIAENWFSFLSKAGYERAELRAGMNVGRYAWAKEGAQYADPQEAARQTKKFAEWVKQKKIPYSPDQALPVFHNPQEIANYRHPTGYTLTDKQIKGDYLLTGSFSLGKAYMLDQEGHGEWDAVIDLSQWRNKARSTKAAKVNPSTDLSPQLYIDLMHPVEGASDAAFWSQYLTEDEGEPVFGFGDQFDESLSNKGNPIIYRLERTTA